MNQTNQITIPHPFNYIKNNNTMETNQFFSTDRFRHLMSRELSHYKRIALILIAVLFIVLLGNAMSMAFSRDHNFHEFAYPFYLIIGGSILTSLSFTEMDRSYGKQFYLLLPASHFEKFLSKWLLMGLGFFSIFTIIYYIAATVAKPLGNTIFGYDIGAFHITDHDNLLFIQIFFALQTLFLLGATYFRKFAIFKTVLSTFFTVACMIMIGALLFRIIMFDLFDGLYHFNPTLEVNDKMMSVQPSEGFQKFMRLNGENIVRLWGLWIIPAVLLVVGYFKLKETEL